LGPEISLIPMPRSSLQRPGFLWPAQRICECLLAEGLGRDIEPCLVRTAPLSKASLAAPGQRPNPIDHYHSTRVRRSRRSAPQVITLVDDVVTRGASFIGMYARLQEAYPNVQIHCFALIRTISSGEIDEILDPVQGEIRYENNRLSRVP
jgi:predicted amidophosphoribosyltransferase